jgi:hypothetical protein
MTDGIVVYSDARGKSVGNHLLKKVEKICQRVDFIVYFWTSLI